MNYGIPAFYLNGKKLVHIAGYKSHVGFYPGAKAIASFSQDLDGEYNYSKGTIQFKLTEELPLDSIEKIIRFRMGEINN